MATPLALIRCGRLGTCAILVAPSNLCVFALKLISTAQNVLPDFTDLVPKSARYAGLRTSLNNRLVWHGHVNAALAASVASHSGQPRPQTNSNRFTSWP